jgi:disulfide bond formation protein DsbB
MIAFFRKRPEAVFPAFVFALGLAAILIAWGFQLIGGYIPCALCLQQRIPSYLGVPLAFAALGAALAGAPPRASRMLLAIAALIFALGIYLGIYHSGVEWGWWLGPADCSPGGATPTGSTADLLAQLDNIRVVSCTEASLRVLGLSFAGWNTVVSLVLVVAGFFGAFRGLRGDLTRIGEAGR